MIKETKFFINELKENKCLKKDILYKKFDILFIRFEICFNKIIKMRTYNICYNL